MAKEKIVKKKKKSKKTVAVGRLYVYATFNNTIVTCTDENGNVLAWETAGKAGFKGSRKATPYAAQVAAGKVADTVKTNHGLEKVDVFIKGIGSGRESAVRAFQNAGIYVSSIKDITPTPHNGVRPKKPRRV